MTNGFKQPKAETLRIQFGLLLIAWGMLANCAPQALSRDVTPLASPALALSRLSGEWTGRETLTSAGTCKLQSGVTSVSTTVRMIWTVTDEGDVSIFLPGWVGVYGYSFVGKVQPDLSISLELASKASCGGINPYVAHHNGVIKNQGGTLSLETEGTEVWCPMTCVFRRSYSIQKPVTSP